MWKEIKQKKKEFNKKLFNEALELFVQWFEKNPNKFIAAINVTPSFNDGDPCYPYFKLVAIGPGYVQYYGLMTFENNHLSFSDSEDENLSKSEEVDWVLDFVTDEWINLSNQYNFSETNIQVVFYWSENKLCVRSDRSYDD
jgi:hypothetical protein